MPLATLLLRHSGTLVVLLLLTIWELVSRLHIAPSQFFPPVTTILTALWSLVISFELVQQYVVTLWHAGAGFLLGTAAAIVMGVLMGYYRNIFNLFEPLIEALRPIPTVALIPVAILLLGIDNTMKVFIVGWACFFPVWVNTVESIRSVDSELVDTAKTFKFTDAATISKFLVPCAAPGIFTGMRISVAFALILSVVSEMVAGDTGVGHFLIATEGAFQISQMYAAVFSLAAVGYVLNSMFVAIERRVLRWHNDSGNNQELQDIPQ